MQKNLYKIFLIFFLFLKPFSVFANEISQTTNYGVVFQCDSEKESKKLLNDLNNELILYDLTSAIKLKSNKNNIHLFLDSNLGYVETTNITKDFNLVEDAVFQPVLNKKIFIASKKEILLSLTYPGRLTMISSCNINSLKEHIGIRQNIVLWASNLSWEWPDGESAFWNKKLWHFGTPHNLNKTYEALYDSFLNQKKYGIGCYTATKMVYVFSILDYYKRVNPNSKKFHKILKILNFDNDPLVHIEPGVMWKFEDDYNVLKDNYNGKLLDINENVAKNSFVPGDWIYLLNTDKETYQKTGYEGSNAVYLGNNNFDDYYNDNNHSYTFEEKLDEVYQWKNKVFSRSRDFEKLEYLSEEKIQSLKNSPDNNGLLMTTRIFPKFFN